MNTKRPNANEVDLILNELRKALEAGRAFLVMAEMPGNAMAAGSGRKKLVPFMVGCMMANEYTADLIMNAAMNFIREKIEDEVCNDCDKINECTKIAEMCATAVKDLGLKKEFPLFEKMQKPCKN
jgi:hypothetical protein